MSPRALCVFLTLAASSPFVLAKDNAIDGPEAPVPPAVLSRDAKGRVTLRATRLAEPIVVDGRLAELVYRQVPSMTDFIQQEPREGQLATEQTEVWVFFDDKNVYVSARCWDSHPEKIVANEMRRDNRNIFNNANFAVIFDTFYDRRNGFLFHTNPLGALFDAQVTDERNFNSDWNTVWDVKTGRWERGWLVEMKIPFRSLRYRGAGEGEIWGINFRRIVRWKNETSYLTPIAAAFREGGLAKLSQAATIVGLETPSKALDIELKPYATAAANSDFEADPPFENELDGDVGFDLKYGVTRGLTFDFTLNTDFAQVEADEQQVNLTRFGLFFPEKRDFFLEGKDIFTFGGVAGPRRGGDRPDNTPIMFFSRQIGLYDEEIVPINEGARLTGRAGAYTLGLLAIQTDELPQLAIPTTDFGVVRVKRDIFRRSNIGVIGTYRSPVFEADGKNESNQLYGVDGNFTFSQNLDINTYYARSETTGVSGDNASYRGRFQYGGDLWGLTAEHLVVEKNFIADVGFLRREDFRESLAELRFSPRPQWSEAIRQFEFEVSFDYVTNGVGQLETRDGRFAFRSEFESGDSIFTWYHRFFEFLDEEFDITDDVIVPIGEYRFERYGLGYRLGPQRRVSGFFGVEGGTFLSGERKELVYFGRWELTRQLSFEPRLALNWVDLPEGSFTANLARLRVNYMISPRIFLEALIQYNSSDDLAATNIRFRWEYQPGSDFFVVYSDGRDTLRLDPRGIPRLETQSLVIKFTRLFRF